MLDAKVLILNFYSAVNVNHIQDGGGAAGGGQKGPPNRFSPVTYANVGISRKNFLTFSFNPYATLV